MTVKRFDWEVCDGDALFYENGALIDYDDVVELLNELHEKNEQLTKQLQTEHTMLDNAILLERTRMGQNSLKQYRDAIK